MKTAIYLSNSKIQMVIGEANKRQFVVKSFATYPLPENALINGVVTNEEAMVEVLTKLKSEQPLTKDIRLVIDSSLILFKLCKLPKLPHQRLLGLVKNQMAEFEDNYEDLIYDYSIIKGSADEEGLTVLACAAERSLIGGLNNLFDQVGIKIKVMDLALNSAIDMVGFMPELASDTYVLANINESFVMLYLFVDGAYTFSNRSRLISPVGSDEYLIELSSKISSLLQFHKSQKLEHEISKLYINGLSEDVFVNAKRVLSLLPVDILEFTADGLAIKVEDTSQDFKIYDYFYCMGMVVRK